MFVHRLLNWIPSLLSVSSLAILDFKKGTNVFLQPLIVIVSADVTFFESTPFFPPSPSYESQEEEDDLLVYFVHPVSSPQPSP